MKKVKVKLMMFAAGLAIFGAVTTKVQNVRAAGDDTLYWFTPGDSYLNRQNSVASEKTLTGCNGNASPCENGYRGDQFNIVNDPTSGIADGESPSLIQHN